MRSEGARLRHAAGVESDHGCTAQAIPFSASPRPWHCASAQRPQGAPRRPPHRVGRSGACFSTCCATASRPARAW